MRHSKTVILLLGLISLGARGAEQVDSVSIEAAKRFLHQYAELSYLQRLNFVELYSDRAVVRVHAQGQPTGQRILGRLYKQWLGERLRARVVELDVSQFKDVRLERRGSRLVIRANRYVANRCYWDSNYLLGLEREGGRWLVVDEAITTQPQAQCSQAGRVAVAAAPTTPNLASRVIMRAAASAPAPWTSPLRELSVPSSPAPQSVANEPSSAQTALLGQRAAEAHAIAQQLAALYGPAGAATFDAKVAPQSGAALGAVRLPARTATTPLTATASLLWVTPD